MNYQCSVVLVGTMQGSTRLLVTHQRQHLPACDRIIVLRDGRIAADGNYAELQVSAGTDPWTGLPL